MFGSATHELIAKISADTNGFERGLGSATNKFKGFASKLIGLAGAIGLGKLIADSVSSGGELEQSIGGIETLFGAGGRSVEEYAKSVGKSVKEVEGEYNALMKSQKKVLKNAEKAYETTGLSANDYMQNVTSFSASLLQSLGGDTEKAANVADMAMIDMADNANKMGTSMESIQNAYQGFAKQNYTMLDNLKLGYGGTKTEMERLLADAEKISGVKYDISNLSDVYEAIHVIQGELDITGTTAREASETLQGSASAMKASFTNLFANMALGEDISDELSAVARTVSTFLFGNLLPMIWNVVKSIPPVVVGLIKEGVPQLLSAGRDLITNLVTGVKEGFPNFLTEIQRIVDEVMIFLETKLPEFIQSGIDLVLSLVDGLIEGYPQLVTQLATFLMDLINTIQEKLPTFLAKGAELLTNIINGIVERIPAAIDSMLQMISSLLSLIAERLPEFMRKGWELILNIINGIAEKAPTLLQKMIDVIIQVIGKIKDKLPEFLQKGLQIIISIADGFIKNIPHIVTAIFNVIKNVIAKIMENLPKFLKAGLDLIAELAIGLIKAIPKLVAKIPQIITAIIKGLMNGLKGIYDVGANLIKGLWNGIASVKDWIMDKVGGFANNIIGGIKNFFGIHSPSRVFRDEVGAMLGKGLAIGIEKEEGTVTKAMDVLENATMRDMSNNLNMSQSGLIDLDYNSTSLQNSLKTGLDVGSTINVEKQPANIILQLGQRQFEFFVDDITKQQDLTMALES